MKKLLSALLIVTLALTSVVALTACSNSANSAGDNATEAPANASSVTIAIPNDTTNEARALLLLQELGYIKLKADAGITATPRDIEDNPKNIEFAEIEAAQLPSALKDYDYAVINSNYAIDAGLNPVKDSLGIEGSASAYVNIIAVKAGNENEPKIKALVAATESKKVVDYINENYDGRRISPLRSPSSPTMYSPTSSSITANLTRTTSSTFRIWTTSTPRTVHLWYPLRASMLSRSVFTAASRAALTP